MTDSVVILPVTEPKTVEQPDVDSIKKQLEANAATELSTHQAKVETDRIAALADSATKFPEYHKQ
jgi:hypothetical protein